MKDTIRTDVNGKTYQMFRFRMRNDNAINELFNFVNKYDPKENLIGFSLFDFEFSLSVRSPELCEVVKNNNFMHSIRFI